MTGPGRDIAIAAALSAHVDARFAAEQTCAECAAQLGDGPVDLAFVFFSGAHLHEAVQLARIIRSQLGPKCLLGLSAESVLGHDVEIERSAGLSLMAMRLPGVRVQPFTTDSLATVDPAADDALERVAAAIHAGPDLRATILLVDPFSVPLVNILPAMCQARHEGRAGAIVGGLASASNQAGGNMLIFNDRVASSGGIGVSLSGALRVDAFASQGCRPIGENYVITGAQRNLVTHLGGRPVVDVLREVLEPLNMHDKDQLQRGGLLLGRVVTEYKERFGQGDYLIRNVVSVNPQMGVMAVADLVRVGQTVRFHIRDAQTAHDDLAMLLDAQKLHERPKGVLLLTCNGRGTRLFPEPSHDASMVTRAFEDPERAEQKAKPGRAIDALRRRLPVAGFFGAGEIGPIGEDSYVHGHSAVVTVFRTPDHGGTAL